VRVETPHNCQRRLDANDIAAAGSKDWNATVAVGAAAKTNSIPPFNDSRNGKAEGIVFVGQ